MVAVARPGVAVWVLGLLAAWLLATLGMRPLMLPDEGRYATVALEMLRGSALVPTLNGLPFFHKPPLFYWLGSAAMELFGVNEFAVRLGSMIGAWVMGGSLFFAIRRAGGSRLAVIAVSVLATSPFFYIGAQYANHDMLVAGLITAAVLALARAVEQSPDVNLKWLLVGAVACGLGTLAKGLIGLVLPALVIVPWLLLHGRWRQACKLAHPLALLAFLMVAGPWFVSVQLQFPEFFDYFFMEQHFRRFSQSGFNNVQPPWFYIALLPALMLPWAAWIPSALWRALVARNAQTGLYIWWLFVIVSFFSLPNSKLAGYVLPAVAPLSALIAMELARGSERRWKWAVGGSALLCLSIVGAIAWEGPKSSRGAAMALASQIQPGDRVAMVDEYLFDVPFYTRLREPIVIVSDWTDPDLRLRDNWRKALLDAARLNLKLGETVMQPIDKLDSLSCGTGAVWFPVSLGRVQSVAKLTGVEKVFGDKNGELWRAPARMCE